MAIYIRPNLYSFIVAQSVSLEAQQQLMGLFWTLALAVILLFLFVGVMMALSRVIRRRMLLNEKEAARRKAGMDHTDPWGESGKRLDPAAGDGWGDDESESGETGFGDMSDDAGDLWGTDASDTPGNEQEGDSGDEDGDGEVWRDR